MVNVAERCEFLMNKVENKEKLAYDEFIEIISYGLEMQFYFKKNLG